ncbi:MAG: TetR/AcrR family transcriptional regulator [Nakamurella sp.]
MSTPPRRPGRPAGATNTRDLVLAAARRAFTEKGYDAASLRQIAGDAGVDQGMVRHYYTDKAGLFRAAMELSIDPQTMLQDLLAGGRDGLGERLLRWFLRQWDETREHSPMVILVRSAVTHEESTRMLREFVTAQVLGPLAAAMQTPDRELRASLVGSQMIGLVMARYIVRVEPLASADHDTVVAAVAPTLQRYLTGAIC